MEIKRLLVINVPIKNCNLKCEYCYIYCHYITSILIVSIV